MRRCSFYRLEDYFAECVETEMFLVKCDSNTSLSWGLVGLVKISVGAFGRIFVVHFRGNCESSGMVGAIGSEKARITK